MTRDQTYILDTNVFNDVCDGQISTDSFTGLRLFVTGVQADELQATKDTKRRALLLTVFKDIAPTSLLASSFAFEIEGAGFDQAYWNDGSGNFDKMLACLQTLDRESKKSTLKSKESTLKNQLKDILIAETAIKNAAILVSGDCNLRKVVSEFGGHSIHLNELLSQKR